MAPERPCIEDNAGVAVTHMLSLTTTNSMLDGDGTLIEEQVGVEDDDLTSLSWLVQNKNILKGINLKPQAAQTSPTSDFAEDGSSISEKSDRGDSASLSSIEPSNVSVSKGATNTVAYVDSEQSVIKAVKTSKVKHPHHIPYDPMVHINSKPPYSFSCLIFMAIEDSPARALPVKQIYNWIQSHFPFYRNAPTGWKNSVRHNLSLNKCFCKVEKAPHLGKGSLWMVDPVFRPNLLQSISKAPINSLTFLERPSTHNLSTLSGSEQKSNGGPPKYLNSNGHKSLNKTTRLPNAELFPFLSRRLAASGVENPGVSRLGENVDGESEDEEDEVDAAQAMLSLKHGPRVLGSKTEDIYKRSYVRKMNSQRTRKSSVSVPVITTSPSEDHTYSAGANMSPDEAFGEGSDTDDGTEITPGHPSLPEESVASDAEEQRRIAEGAADALLNLAGFRATQSTPLEGNRVTTRPLHRSPEKSSSVKRARRHKQQSRYGNSDYSRQQQLRSIRKREKLALEQELIDRKNLMKAEILADLAVIRNNNNIVLGEDISKVTALSTGSINHRSSKVKTKRQTTTSFKPNVNQEIADEFLSNPELGKRAASSQKRKRWSHEGNLRKSRR